ncbi:MAG: helix-turn-helix transcriptional regulator [Negativicutes bacterium]|nr:helix-turn-helix transcriptional regulator [Negativicutes bacterium]
MFTNEEPRFYRHVCTCGKKVEAIGRKTVCLCKCRKTMQKVDSDDFKSVRVSKGIKQNEAAKKLGISNTYLSKIESGTVPITHVMSEKIRRLYA